MPRITKICTIEQCNSKHYAHGFCSKHWQRWRKHGDPSYRKLPDLGGLSSSSEYSIWVDMIRRCYNSNVISYKNYGARGIKVCDRWKNSFLDFYNDIGKRPSMNHQIDRIDNDGNYEPGNCRWVTVKETSNNRRTNHYITINNKTQTVQQWCDEFNIPDTTFHGRLKRGWYDTKLIN